jgi:hypothetical protein
VVVIMDPDGTRVSSTRIENSPMNLAAAVREAGPEPEVVLETTWGWYWAADVIEGRHHHRNSPKCCNDPLSSQPMCAHRMF